jgi:hypothetical protein
MMAGCTPVRQGIVQHRSLARIFAAGDQYGLEPQSVQAGRQQDYMDGWPADIQPSNDAQDFDFVVRDWKRGHADMKEGCLDAGLRGEIVLGITVSCHRRHIDAVIHVCSPPRPHRFILKHPQPHLRGQEHP